MSKLGEKLFYDIQELFIDGFNAEEIAAQLNCPVDMVGEYLVEFGVAEIQHDFSPYATVNS